MATNAKDTHPAKAAMTDAERQHKYQMKKLEKALGVVKAVGIDPNVGLDALLDPSRPHKKMSNRLIIRTAKQIKEWRLAATILGPIQYNELKEKGELALARKKKLQAIAAT